MSKFKGQEGGMDMHMGGTASLLSPAGSLFGGSMMKKKVIIFFKLDNMIPPIERKGK